MVKKEVLHIAKKLTKSSYRFKNLKIKTICYKSNRIMILIVISKKKSISNLNLLKYLSLQFTGINFES